MRWKNGDMVLQTPKPLTDGRPPRPLRCGQETHPATFERMECFLGVVRDWLEGGPTK